MIKPELAEVYSALLALAELNRINSEGINGLAQDVNEIDLEYEQDVRALNDQLGLLTKGLADNSQTDIGGGSNYDACVCFEYKCYL